MSFREQLLTQRINDIQDNDSEDLHPSVYVQRYLRLAAKMQHLQPLKFWETYKDELKPFYQKALDTLHIPLTSSAIESGFSIAGIETRAVKNRTEYELLNMKMFVRINGRFV